MSKSVVEIDGFKELQSLIKELPDKVKKREMAKIMRQVADPTYKAMKQAAPVYSGKPHKKRQVGKTVIAGTYVPGYGKKTIFKKVLRKTENPVISVGPHTRKGKDGYYMRQWVIRGTRYHKGNDFVDAAFQQTQGRVTADAEARTARYIQKNIDKLITKYY